MPTRNQKRVFYQQYIKKFGPINIDSFQFLPFISASGGSIILWNSSKFTGNLLFQNSFAQSVEFQCTPSGESWVLTNVYGPCTPERKLEFLRLFKEITMPDEIKWLIVGDFNLLHSPSNRNKPVGNIQEMLKFNEAISKLRISEIPLDLDQQAD